ncbi:unnamed protein product, partial [Adineta steineri]
QKIKSSIWHSLIELNLFQSSIRRQQTDIKQQRYSTRIYIICLIIALVSLIFYTILIVQTKQIQINNPSPDITRYLQSQSEFSSSVQCPCTNISVPYEEIVTLQPSYHQMCVNRLFSSGWATMARSIRDNGDIFIVRDDFRYSYEFFYLLNEVCQLSNEMIVSSLETFTQTQLVTNDLLSVDLFTSQMSSIVKQFQSDLPQTFFRFFQLVRNITYANQIFAFINNVQYELIDSPLTKVSFSINGFQGINGNSSYTCSCANDINCNAKMRLYGLSDDSWSQFTVPGLYIACTMYESLLQSTVECFYDDQDCVKFIIDFYDTAWVQLQDFPLLNSSIPSRFPRNSSINSISSELFIEFWNQSLNYSSYFDNCQPKSCSYTILQRNNLVTTITIIIGLIGGLSVSFRIIVPIVVTIYFYLIGRRQNQSVVSEPSPIRARLLIFINAIQNWLRKLNVFDNPKQTTAYYIQKQQRATYVYFVLLSIGLVILLIYNSLNYSTITFTVTNPSLKQYQELQQQYGIETVTCPCSQLSITHSSFIDLEYDFHPVCTSPFISHDYLQQLFQIYNSLDSTYARDNAFTLQGTMFSHFQALLILCNLVKDAVNDARQNYLTSSVISALMIDYNTFNEQMNASLSQFKSTLPNQFLNNFQLIRDMVQANGLVSLYSSNWYPLLHDWNYYQTAYMEPQYYGSCSCFTSSSCTQPSVPNMKGYLVGCTPIEALLRSSIACLYEQDCINTFTVYLNLPLPAPPPLN